MNYVKRFYRDWVKTQGLVSFAVKVKETDLFISAQKDLSKEAEKSVIKYRREIENYIEHNPLFEVALLPVEVEKDAPDIIKEMAEQAKKCDVGPMAAVAGAIAEFVGKDLLKYSSEIIVENGGDIFIKTDKERKIGIFAGHSPLSGKISILIDPKDTPMGVCTSSGTVGPSFSFGQADAAVILSKSATLADAVATATANKVSAPSDIEKGVNYAKSIKGVTGALVVKNDKMALWGSVKIA